MTMTMNIVPIKRALLSVSDKTGIVEFAKELVSLGVEIISTGGTAQLLQKEQVPHKPVEEITGLAEMLDGRVKTLHPKVHGGILGRRDVHADEAKQHGIQWIDLVVVNFYPFRKTVTDISVPWEKAIEYIDIGGPTMVRAAAKNHAWVGVVTEPSDYPVIISALKKQNGLDDSLRRQLAAKAFAQTASFDTAVEHYFMQKLQDEVTTLSSPGTTLSSSGTTLSSPRRRGSIANLEMDPRLRGDDNVVRGDDKVALDDDNAVPDDNNVAPDDDNVAPRDDKGDGPQPLLDFQLASPIELRYGENPHQKAYAYPFNNKSGVLAAHIQQGKALSYNNLLDADAAWTCVSEFNEPACVIVKHANPCGAATAATIDVAYETAYQADALSAFGGIIALNRPCTKQIAEAVTKIFMEIVIAPAYSEEALTILSAKPNLRVLVMPEQEKPHWEMKFITGGVLMQEKDPQVIQESDLTIVTKRKPNSDNLADMTFAWRVLKHIKSNAILLAKHRATVGIGAGQVSRVDAVDIALRKAGERISGTILASDAFFPFRDSIDKLAGTGVSAIIQPGGSVRDEEVIAACDEHDIAMAFTGKRCFRH